LHILFLSRWFPYPPDNGARIRIFNLIKGLAARHTLELISFCDNSVSGEHQQAMRQWCQSVVSVPYRPFQPNSGRALLGLFSNKPRSVIDTYHAEFAVAVQAAAARQPVDLLIASEIDMAVYGVPLRGAKKILEELEVTKISRPYLTEAVGLRKLRYGMTWWKLVGYIRELLNCYDGCTVVSEIEQMAVKALHAAGAPVVIPNGVDTDYFRPTPGIVVERDALIYNGAISYAVNFEAVAYFIREIFPLILAERPDALFYVTGKAESSLVSKLPKHEQVVFTGYLADIRPQLLKCCVNVIPILTGGGTRLKILESLAAGVPVVSTAAGAEGLNLMNGKEILIADEPRAFARAVLHLLQDAPAREALRRNGRQFVEAHSDWRVINAQFECYIEQVMQLGHVEEKA